MVFLPNFRIRPATWINFLLLFLLLLLLARESNRKWAEVAASWFVWWTLSLLQWTPDEWCCKHRYSLWTQSRQYLYIEFKTFKISVLYILLVRANSYTHDRNMIKGNLSNWLPRLHHGDQHHLTTQLAWIFTLESPLGDEMHHILNVAIILGGHLHHLVQEVISGITKRWSEVTNHPGDHLLTRSRTDSLPVLTFFKRNYCTYANIMGDGQLFECSWLYSQNSDCVMGTFPRL